MSDVFEVKYSEGMGRYLVAKKNLKRGQLVLKESPLLVYPDLSRPNKVPKGHFICFACHRVEPVETAVICTHCRWLACSPKCVQNTMHRSLECEILETNGVRPSFLGCRYLCILRSFLLRMNDQAKWSKLVNLTSQFSVLNNELMRLLQREAHEAFIFLRHQCNMNVILEEVATLTNILAINAFGFTKTDDDGYLKWGYASVYATTCLMAHSCSPSLDWELPSDWKMAKTKGCDINLYCKRDIKAGEMVTIAYMEDFLTKGTVERQALILEKFHFVCVCERCIDRTELNTFFSALVCTMCNNNGFLLPDNPFNRETQWRCVSCKRTRFRKSVELTVKTYEIEYEKLLDLYVHDQEKAQEALDQMISTASDKYGLHPNHHLSIRSTTSWLMFHDFQVLLGNSKATEQAYQKIIRRIKRCLSIFQTIGTTMDCVMMETCYAMAIIRYRFKSEDYRSVGHAKSRYSLKSRIQIIQRALKHMKRGIALTDRQIQDADVERVGDILRDRYYIWNTRMHKMLKLHSRNNTSKFLQKKADELQMKKK